MTIDGTSTKAIVGISIGGRSGCDVTCDVGNGNKGDGKEREEGEHDEEEDKEEADGAIN